MAYTPILNQALPTMTYIPASMEETSTAITYKLGNGIYDYAEITEAAIRNDPFYNNYTDLYNVKYTAPALTTSLKYSNDNYIKWSTWTDYSLAIGGTAVPATWGNSTWVSNNIYGFVQHEELSKKALFVGKLRSNLVIAVKSRVQEIHQEHPAENVALETLREFISEAEFRKYLRYGFILVKGQSGDVFQIFRNRSHTKVWRNGKVVEEVCVRIREVNVPPTDNVIAFRQIIQTSEVEFKKLGNVYKLAA